LHNGRGLFFFQAREARSPAPGTLGDARRKEAQDASKNNDLQKNDNAAQGTRYQARTIQTQGARRKKHSPQDSNHDTWGWFPTLFRAIRGFDRRQIKIHRPSRGVKLRKNFYHQQENTHNSMQFEQDVGQFG
tara:strand:- start:367 stop:762 length:396 start_codon:yes stop_codon:yes gene_type:complete